MSEQQPPPGPDDDRELDDFLAGRSELSRLYRDDAANVRAPAALDAVVLAAVQTAAAVTGKPMTRRWRRWRLPLSLAASMLVGIGVLREARQLPAPLPQSADALAVAAAVAPPVEPAQAQALALAQALAQALAPAPRAEVKRQAAVEPPLRTEAETGRRTSNARREPPPQALLAPPAPSTAAAGASLAPPAVPAAEIPPETASANPPDMNEGVFVPSLPARRAKTTAEPWQPARYRGQTLGTMTVADWQQRYGQPPVMSAPSADASMAPELSTAETRRRLDYGRSVDSRGVLFVRADEESQRIEMLSLRLAPALPLPEVEQAEGLPPAAPDRARSKPGAGDEAGCRDEVAERRLYPAQGIELRLDADGRVAEILYREARPATDCRVEQSE